MIAIPASTIQIETERSCGPNDRQSKLPRLCHRYAAISPSNAAISTVFSAFAELFFGAASGRVPAGGGAVSLISSGMRCEMYFSAARLRLQFEQRVDAPSAACGA